MSQESESAPEDASKTSSSDHNTSYRSASDASAPAAAATQQAHDLSGQTLGEFRMLRKLGGGGMADVYLAEQTALNRNVAFKVMRPDMVSDKTYLDRFKAEAMAAANLNHPNIVQVYTIGQQENLHYIAQEYVQGKNLREFLARKGPPELVVALHIMRQVASALQKAGEVGIVHRDIKPENILISRKGVAKIADFGLAQLSLGGERLNLTQEGVTMGTPLYMSPEQVQGNKVDHRSDLYSFGVTCYHMFSGRPPYRGETALAIAMKHVNSKATPLEKRRPDLPPEICEIVHRMMAKKPSDRYQNAGDILKALRKFMKSLQDGPQPEVSMSAFDASTQAVRKASIKSMMSGDGTGTQKLPYKKLLMSAAILMVLGIGLGWVSRPKLPKSHKLDAVEHNTPRDQFADAMLHEVDEDKWLAVIEQNPTSEERWKAEQRLAILYLKQARYDEARKIFDTLIEQQGNGDRFNVCPVGHAGHAIIACLKGSYTDSDGVLNRNLAMLSQKLEGPLVPLVRQAIEVNQEKLGSRANVTLEKMFPQPEQEEA